MKRGIVIYRYRGFFLLFSSENNGDRGRGSKMGEEEKGRRINHVHRNRKAIIKETLIFFKAPPSPSFQPYQLNVRREWEKAKVEQKNVSKKPAKFPTFYQNRSRDLQLIFLY